MDKPDPRQVFAAAVQMLECARCPECGQVHDDYAAQAHCGWCADRGLVLELHQQWRTHDRQVNGAALSRRARRVMDGQVPFYQVRGFNVFKL